MERGESILDDVLDEDTLNFDSDDVEMADADAEETPVADSGAPAGGGGDGGGGQAERDGPAGKKKKKKRKSGKKKKKGKPDGPPKIADINRFVLDTCKRLKEKKSYLVWNAVGCLGVSAVSDLVREVEAIQKCGGQTIADGSRFRTGGGILWNILKSREPKAYNEIMAKGRELEKQFRYTKARPQMSRNEDASSQGSVLVDEENEAQDEKEVLDDPEHLVHVEKAPLSDNKAERKPAPLSDNKAERKPAPLSDNKAERKPVADRIRVPVAYDDLFEEGEIHEGESQN